MIQIPNGLHHPILVFRKNHITPPIPKKLGRLNAQTARRISVQDSKCTHQLCLFAQQKSPQIGLENHHPTNSTLDQYPIELMPTEIRLTSPVEVGIPGWNPIIYMCFFYIPGWFSRQPSINGISADFPSDFSLRGSQASHVTGRVTKNKCLGFWFPVRSVGSVAIR